MRKQFSLIFSGLLLGFSACEQSSEQHYEPTIRHFDDAADKKYADRQFAVYDPAEGVNKQIYKFNAKLDEFVLLPLVDAYMFIAPEFARTRVTNFFRNVGEVTNFTNALFQVNPGKAGITLGRFAINTTVGLIGTFDVATGWGLKRQPEDFGKTLGHWGAGNGPYIVLPLLGPSNLRDTVGQVVDYATLAILIPHDVKQTAAYDVIAYGLQPLDLRYSNNFRYYSSGSPFEYEIVRFVVTQVRTDEIAKEKRR